MTKDEFLELNEYNDDIKDAFKKIMRNDGNVSRTGIYYKIKTFRTSLSKATPLYFDYFVFLTEENIIDFTEEIQWLLTKEPLDFSFSELHPILKDEFKRLMPKYGLSTKSYSKIFDNLEEYPEIKEEFNEIYKDVITQESTINRIKEIISKTVEVNIEKLSDIKVDSELFETVEIDDEYLNTFWSRDGGIKKGTTNVIIGDPGAGKTMFAFDLLSKLKNAKCLYISAEMTRVEVVSYTKNMDLDIDFVFLHDYHDSDPFSVIQQVLNAKYDIVCLDSLSEIIVALQDSFANTSNAKIERELMNLIKDHTKGKTGIYTSFLIIQQVTKTGQFVGGNSLKHNTSSMLHINRFDCESKKMYFSKNRNADIAQEIYFKIVDGFIEYTDTVEYYEEDEIMEL